MNMRSHLSFVAAVLLSSGVAAAAPTERDMVVHTSKTMLDVKVDATTVTCSNGELKVTAPKLAFLTLMSHHDFTLEAPALSAGMCEPGRMPQDIIDAMNPVASTEVLVKAIRRDRVDIDTDTCTNYLVERVETYGHPVQSSVAQRLGEFGKQRSVRGEREIVKPRDFRE